MFSSISIIILLLVKLTHYSAKKNFYNFIIRSFRSEIFLDSGLVGLRGLLKKWAKKPLTVSFFITFSREVPDNRSFKALPHGPQGITVLLRTT